jgi:ribosomal protein S18 acetylase RimI-like enzyme
VEIVRVDPAEQARAEACARLMVANEPWLTLRRTFPSALRALQDPGKELYAAFDAGLLAGFVLIDMRSLTSGYIQSLAVRADRRRRGVGTTLIGFAEERIFRDSPNVFVCASSFNDGARRLYERLGYRVVGTLTDHVIAGHDELLMRKTRGPWGEHAGY